jgi:hypothetical protein
MKKRNKPARAVPPPAYHEFPLGIRLNATQGFEELAVVTIVRVAVAAALSPRVRGPVELKLKVGNTVAPLGLVVKAAVRDIPPVKPPVGVTVIVEVFPVVAPATMLTGVPLIVKLEDVTW